MVSKAGQCASEIAFADREDTAAALGRVEEVHVRSTSPSAVPALRSRAKNREQEVPAGAFNVSLALCARIKVVELDREAEASGEGASYAAVVFAKEVVSAAAGGGGEPSVAHCPCYGGESDGNSEKSKGCLVTACCSLTRLEGETLIGFGPPFAKETLTPSFAQSDVPPGIIMQLYGAAVLRIMTSGLCLLARCTWHAIEYDSNTELVTKQRTTQGFSDDRHRISEFSFS
ncbi:hypothetical protein PLEOSDRAFT_1099895 [Pleurotus ostreatus PC15]|uniref:Uncharacterized protein n=1 Tax=Pleurotus ostreatus (strain PC15) TaxID=1137138 RepID=A0A067PDI8_PLEO1|nr:hypothetical protein PLEOSDRAFT_1099895 [Pleurotus ostreatus PC15]